MAKPSKNSKPVAPNPDDPSSYDAFDGEWRAIGLTGPARRALVNAKLYKVSDLRKITAEELSALHGMGKSAIARCKQIMAAKKIKFRVS
jgi:hypothetical protein